MIYDSTEEYFADQIKRIEEFTASENGFFTAASTTHAELIERIFDEGKKTDGSQIGTYSTKPTYIDPAKSPVKFAGKGKNGAKTKTKYFQGGYKQFRGEIGRQNAKVDLALSNAMRLEFSNNVTSENGNWVYSIDVNRHKAKGAENKYGVIFKLSDQERADHAKRVELLANRWLNR